MWKRRQSERDLEQAKEYVVIKMYALLAIPKDKIYYLVLQDFQTSLTSTATKLLIWLEKTTISNPSCTMTERPLPRMDWTLSSG